MTRKPQISVIVPAYNAAETIDRCLEALADQTVPQESYEIVVVDDGSTDETAARIERHVGVRLLTQGHAGPAAARNLGVQHAQGSILLFTDSDCAPVRDWIECMMAPFRDKEVVGVKGTYLTRQREIVPRFVQAEYEDKYDRMAKEKYIDFVDTYAAGYRRDVFAKGGFDPAFPVASVEDQEFSFRLARQGYKMVFAPEARVYHLGHARNLWAYWRRKFNIGYWKVVICRQYPDKAWRDSHTPQILKGQILLIGIGILCFLGGLLRLPIIWGSVISGFLFLLTTLPFAFKALGKHPLLALVSPGLLLVRALALGMGFAVGLLTNLGWKGRIGVQERPGCTSAGAALSTESHQTRIKGPTASIKRMMDIVGALIGIPLAAPLMFVMAVLIALDSRGPVLFVQERVGKGGKTFKIYKLRTMVANAEELLDQFIDIDALDEPVFKLKDDPRVTRVGRFLRRWSLDELPQLLNVLRGEMSLVGPRPEEVRIVRYYSGWHRQRLMVKPGVTGPVQIHGRADLSLEERVRLELEYIGNWSLGKDFVILLRTIPAVVRGDGVY